MIQLKDVVNFFEYEKIRDERRHRVIELKARRRVEVGPYLSFVFENRETLLFQIQEMCRAERIVVSLARQEPVGEWTVAYLNRLSDALFVLARAANASAGVDDVLWDSRA